MQNSMTREELVSVPRVIYSRMEDATCSCHKHQLCPVGFMGSCFMGVGSIHALPQLSGRLAQANSHFQIILMSKYFCHASMYEMFYICYIAFFSLLFFIVWFTLTANYLTYNQ